MGATNGNAYDGNNFVTIARMRYIVDGTPSATSLPSRIEFSTTPLGTKVSATRMTIKESGNVGIGTSTP
jgi:hypothetical protein